MSRGQKKTGNRYASLIEEIFLSHYTAGATELHFHRDELTATAKQLLLRPLNSVMLPHIEHEDV